jgi:protein TonB
VPRRATPPKPDDPPPADRAVPAVLARPKPAGALAAAPAPRKRAPAKPKPLIVAPEVPPVAAPSRQGPPRRTARIAPAGALPPAVIPREALVSPRHDRLLAAAIGLSVLLHLVVLTIHFTPIVLKQMNDKGPPIEVALVNAKTAAKPAKADVLAQHNLDGGGNTDADRRAKTPLPVLPRNAPDQQIAVATQKVEELEKQTRELMTQLRNAPVAQSLQAHTEARERTDLPTANELMQKTLEAMRLEAQIAKDMDAYQKRPKRRFIGARAEEYRFARYVEDWRLKIERIGNLNYPEAARKQKLYGSLLLTVSIRADGSVEHVEINRGSGNRILDAAAVRIVNMSGPFAAFPPDIRKDTDILHITRTWTFAKGDLLESK